MLYSQSFEDGVNYLSNFIISDEYENLSKTVSDVAMIDALYTKSLKFYNYDIADALFASAYASLAFREMPVKVPFFGFEVDVPLSRADKKLFDKKIARLPSRLFFDTPLSKFGDRDKLSHFFASAFFSYSVTYFNLSKFMGIFIEIFEAAFKVDGYLDQKDMLINNLGELYGKALRKNPDLLPSSSLKLYNLFYFRITN